MNINMNINYISTARWFNSNGFDNIIQSPLDVVIRRSRQDIEKDKWIKNCLHNTTQKWQRWMHMSPMGKQFHLH